MLRFRRLTFRLAFVSFSAVLALSLTALDVTPAPAQDNKSQRAGATGESSDVARGKYLVEGVAMCGTCHTPRDSQGNFDHSRWLQGGPVPYQPPMPDSNWPQTEPRIGGTPPAPDVDMVKLLTKIG